MTCTIAPITEQDIDGFHAALDLVAREKKYLAFLEAPEIISTRAFVRENIRHDHAQFVARDGETVVGWCDIIPQKSRQIGLHVGTLGIGIVEDWRGKGIGRKLILAAIDKAFAQGLTRIELSVRKDNARAIRLYENLGFVHEGVRRKASLIEGVYADTVLMGLLAEERKA